MVLGVRIVIGTHLHSDSHIKKFCSQTLWLFERQNIFYGDQQKLSSKCNETQPIWISKCTLFQILEFLKSREDFVGTLLRHIGTSAIMDLLLRLLTCIESTEIRRAMVEVSFILMFHF